MAKVQYSLFLCGLLMFAGIKSCLALVIKYESSIKHFTGNMISNQHISTESSTDNVLTYRTILRGQMNKVYSPQAENISIDHKTNNYHVVSSAESKDDSSSKQNNKLYNSLDVVTAILGWIYFVAWALVFYPQIYENWKNKSVVGYNFDMLALDTIDLTVYFAYNIGIYAIPYVQNQYLKEHETSVVPVKLNDVIFCIHGMLSCLVLIIQCRIYERGQQKVSKTCLCFVGGIVCLIMCTIAAALTNEINWVECLSYLSYIKLLAITKYIPQIFLNHRRRSTKGFSIGVVLLDGVGGCCSIGQMITNSYNYNDWTSFGGNPTKVGVGILSIVFDAILALQHYLCYRKSMSKEYFNDSEVDV